MMDTREEIIRLWFDMWLQKRGLGIFPQQLQVRQAGQRFEEGFGEQVQERSRGAGPLRALHQAEAVQGGPAVRLEL